MTTRRSVTLRRPKRVTNRSWVRGRGGVTPGRGIAIRSASKKPTAMASWRLSRFPWRTISGCWVRGSTTTLTTSASCGPASGGGAGRARSPPPPPPPPAALGRLRAGERRAARLRLLLGRPDAAHRHREKPHPDDPPLPLHTDLLGPATAGPALSLAEFPPHFTDRGAGPGPRLPRAGPPGAGT